MGKPAPIHLTVAKHPSPQLISHIPLQSYCHYLHRKVDSHNHAITTSIEKRFGLVYICHRMLERNVTKQKQCGAAFSVGLSPTIHVTPFLGLGIGIYLERLCTSV
jgi:hypothetical protein